MLILASEGFYCSLGDIHINPKGKMNDAVITQAHNDHPRKWAVANYCAIRGLSILKTCLGKNIVVKTYNYSENFYINGIQIPFHSAGYILGSAQIRINHCGETWVVGCMHKKINNCDN